MGLKLKETVGFRKFLLLLLFLLMRIRRKQVCLWAERKGPVETGAWAAITLFPRKTVPSSCAVLTEKGANENTGKERGLMEKRSQKSQDGEGLTEPAGSPAGSSKEGK